MHSKDLRVGNKDLSYEKLSINASGFNWAKLLPLILFILVAFAILSGVFIKDILQIAIFDIFANMICFLVFSFLVVCAIAKTSISCFGSGEQFFSAEQMSLLKTFFEKKLNISLEEKKLSTKESNNVGQFEQILKETAKKDSYL